MKIESIASAESLKNHYQKPIPMKRLPKEIKKIIDEVRDMIKNKNGSQDNSTMHIDLYA